VQLVQGVVQWQVAQRPKCRQAAPTLRSKMPGCAEKKSGADEKAQHSHGRRCGRGAGLSAAGVTGAARRATRGKFAPSTPRSAAENAADANLSGARPSRRPCPIAATPAPTAAADPPDDPPLYAHAPKTAARRFRRHVRLARDAHAPERGEIALLEHDPKPGESGRIFRAIAQRCASTAAVVLVN
jgi:hypothetical protein